ncbi:hypothetical protein [Nostoc sp. FACHB-280]|nr:hypothetical protein [Nostoc sp. FACHB-280]
MNSVRHFSWRRRYANDKRHRSALQADESMALKPPPIDSDF